jgi:hypothetical protein
VTSLMEFRWKGSAARGDETIGDDRADGSKLPGDPEACPRGRRGRKDLSGPMQPNLVPGEHERALWPNVRSTAKDHSPASRGLQQEIRASIGSYVQE